MIKAIFLDLDGTLLNKEHQITPINKKVLMALKTKGIKIFLATGRSFGAMERYHKELELDTPAICFNGAEIVYPDGEVKRFYVENEELITLIKIAQKEDTMLNLYQDGKWLVEDLTRPEVEPYHQLSGLTPIKADFLTLEKKYSNKALFINTHERLLEIDREIKDILGDKVYTTFSKINFLEVLKGGINKGTVMEKIMKNYDISISDVVAFGDGLNDIEMISKAGNGVAMANGFDELKAIANDTTISNNESGVGEYLKKYL